MAGAGKEDVMDMLYEISGHLKHIAAAAEMLTGEKKWDVIQTYRRFQKDQAIYASRSPGKLQGDYTEAELTRLIERSARTITDLETVHPWLKTLSK